MTDTCPTAWPTTRVLFLLAGAMTLLSVVLAATWTTWALLLTAFVGVNQLVFVIRRGLPGLRRHRPRPRRRPAGTVTARPEED